MLFAEVLVLVLAIGVGGVVDACGRGRIPRNPLVGIRLPPLFASDEAWRAGHRAARLLTWCGVVLCVAAQLVALFSASSQQRSENLVLVGAGFLTVFLLAASVRAWRAARAVTST